jgi:hypothetical protein
MSIDSRLRDGLKRSMSKIDTDAELRLTDARRRGRRRLLVRRAGTVVAVAATIATLVVAGPAILGAFCMVEGPSRRRAQRRSRSRAPTRRRSLRERRQPSRRRKGGG